ncbi:FAD:protein FMN transferase [Cytophagales bacterium LB-30]|uniref:FAD:protein FMN transferase n=1 Tax=Shiella aurantiaca TaxID=3058365 RepID=A0ABT8F6Z1_9BACT|nr:FAD:protein FMN transferase [Shiella aurantiaca]MDN4166053.1 FAD:protein FMN transferase [Shiella aurantiaca]
MDANRKKNLIYSLILITLLSGMWWYRNKQNPDTKAQGNQYKIAINGEAQGSTYQIKYLSTKNISYKKAVDSILLGIDQSLSLWVPDSELNQFNRGTQIKFSSPYFYDVLVKSREVYEATEGAFNPALMPLIRAWGFGPEQPIFPEPRVVDSLKAFVNFDSIFFDTKAICKLKKGIQLDFNGIAQGYTVDVLAAFLEAQGIENYMVEVGGEVRCKGKNEENNVWAIGISNPLFKEKGDKEIQVGVRLDNRGLATSGNYRKFYLKDGKKLGHTIDPSTGYPVEHSLLSASVFAKESAIADGLATAFLVRGLEYAKAYAAEHPEIDVLLLYADEQGNLASYVSPGIEPYIFEIE